MSHAGSSLLFLCIGKVFPTIQFYSIELLLLTDDEEVTELMRKIAHQERSNQSAGDVYVSLAKYCVILTLFQEALNQLIVYDWTLS